MRLIDKDYAVDTAWSIEVYHGSAREVCEMLEDVPTVDAVPVIRCKDCGQREYGCSTFIDHNQIYGFCAWGWKAERKEEWTR